MGIQILVKHPTPLNQLLHTSELRAKGFDGQGVRVGVISNGTNNYPALRQANILPGNVQIYGKPTAQGDEGDWMMQIVHNIAPAARLGFCAGVHRKKRMPALTP